MSFLYNPIIHSLPGIPVILNWFKISAIEKTFVFNIAVKIHSKMIPKWTKWIALFHLTLVITIPESVAKT